MTKGRTHRSKQLRKQIGENMRNIRMAADLTQKEVGDVLHVSFQQIQKYEKGTNNISPEKLYILKTFYDVPFDSFFKDISPPQQNKAEAKQDTNCLCKRLAMIKDPFLKKKLHAIIDVLTD